jgi:hypothetical protein
MMDLLKEQLSDGDPFSESLSSERSDLDLSNKSCNESFYYSTRCNFSVRARSIISCVVR